MRTITNNVNLNVNARTHAYVLYIIDMADTAGTVLLLHLYLSVSVSSIMYNIIAIIIFTYIYI